MSVKDPRSDIGGDQLSNVREVVRDRYGQAARRVTNQAGSTSCCGGGSCSTGPVEAVDPITRDLYESDELDGIPDLARLASLGCGNPTTVASKTP